MVPCWRPMDHLSAPLRFESYDSCKVPISLLWWSAQSNQWLPNVPTGIKVFPSKNVLSDQLLLRSHEKMQKKKPYKIQILKMQLTESTVYPITHYPFHRLWLPPGPVRTPLLSILHCIGIDPKFQTRTRPLSSLCCYCCEMRARGRFQDRIGTTVRDPSWSRLHRCRRVTVQIDKLNCAPGSNDTAHSSAPTEQLAMSWS
jgi:hypothetical protein